MKKFFPVIFIAFPFLLKAQHPICDFDRLPEKMNHESHFHQLQGRVTDDSTTLLRIPVVIHVLHLKDPIGSPNNPTENRIIETIEYLNKTFRAKWPNYPDTLNGGVDLRIEFVLATEDLSGRPFNGIDRIDASGFSEYAQLGRVGRDLLLNTMWNKYKYFNIWVIHRLEGGRLGFGAAPEPASAPIFNYEGAAVVASSFKAGDPIVVHEAGHYFGLMHTWGTALGNSCPANNNCETEGDYVCDTEPHSEFASCNLIGTINHCTGLPYGNTLKNFMSYSATTCWDRFTRLQKKRMRETIMTLRPDIPNNAATVLKPVTLKELNEFKILPNPNYGNFKIHFIAPVSGNLSISIISTSGQTVFQKSMSVNMVKELPVTVNNLQEGIFFVVLRDKSGVLTNRVFIR